MFDDKTTGNSERAKSKDGIFFYMIANIFHKTYINGIW